MISFYRGIKIYIDEYFGEDNLLDLIKLLTILLLFKLNYDYWYVDIPLFCLCVFGILFKKIRTHADYWFYVSLVLVIGTLKSFYELDNHRFLILYWCITLYFTKDIFELKKATKPMLAAVFIFASLWKLSVADFTSARFFQYALMFDGRFENLALVFSNIDENTINANNVALNKFVFYSQESGLALTSMEQVRPLAIFLTLWTLVIEGLIALTFFLPGTRVLKWGRSLLLLLFIATTYANAPVTSFGWILCIMGIAQDDNENKALKICFFVCFLFLMFYTAPFSAIFSGLFGKALPLTN